jgi:hypothetical protein
VAHTHGTADITGISSSFAAASHTHEASAITSGVLELARIPTIGYTALSGVPTTFAPQAHTHGTADVVGLTASFSQVGHTHDYAASIHTHSTADIAGYTSLPAQGGKAGPLVTDGTAASWSTRYSVVDPVLVQGAGMTLSRDTAAGSITVAFAGGTSGIVVSSATPQPLGTAAAGASGDASRADHVHLMPSAADVGAAPASHSHEYVQVLNGLTGTVSITGGAGVTVSTASSSITIAAAGSYVLPTATASVLGGVKVGSGLTITDGVLAASGGSGSGEDAVLRALFVPPAPTSLTATAGNAQVSLSWSAPSVLSVTPITDYVVQYSSNSGSSWTTFSDGTSTTTSATVTGLTNGTAYVFRVAAVNGVGQGAWSTATSSVTPGDVFRAIPTMTSATSPSGVVSGQTNDTGFAADLWKAFDGNGATGVYFARAGGNSPLRTLQYSFPEGQKSAISGYSLVCSKQLSDSDVINAWQLHGSDDGVSWELLDTKTGQSGSGNYDAGTNLFTFGNWSFVWPSDISNQRTFTLATPATYRMYRWTWSHNDSGSGPLITSAQLLQ